MNLSTIVSGGSVFNRCDMIHGISFANAAKWDRSALLPIICANFALLRDNCAHLYRYEYLSPHTSPV